MRYNLVIVGVMGVRIAPTDSVAACGPNIWRTMSTGGDRRSIVSLRTRTYPSVEGYAPVRRADPGYNQDLRVIVTHLRKEASVEYLPDDPDARPGVQERLV